MPENKNQKLEELKTIIDKLKKKTKLIGKDDSSFFGSAKKPNESTVNAFIKFIKHQNKSGPIGPTTINCAGFIKYLRSHKYSDEEINNYDKKLNELKGDEEGITDEDSESTLYELAQLLIAYGVVESNEPLTSFKKALSASLVSPMPNLAKAISISPKIPTGGFKVPKTQGKEPEGEESKEEISGGGGFALPGSPRTTTEEEGKEGDKKKEEAKKDKAKKEGKKDVLKLKKEPKTTTTTTTTTTTKKKTPETPKKPKIPATPTTPETPTTSKTTETQTKVATPEVIKEDIQGVLPDGTTVSVSGRLPKTAPIEEAKVKTTTTTKPKAKPKKRIVKNMMGPRPGAGKLRMSMPSVGGPMRTEEDTSEAGAPRPTSLARKQNVSQNRPKRKKGPFRKVAKGATALTTAVGGLIATAPKSQAATFTNDLINQILDIIL